MDCFFFFFLFSFFCVLFSLLVYCAHHEVKAQTKLPTATAVSTYHSTAEQQSALHRAAKYIEQYVRVDQTAERDNASKQTRTSVAEREPSCIENCMPRFFLFFVLF